MKAYLYFLLFTSLVFFIFLIVEFISSTIKNRILGYKASDEELEPYESGMLYKDTPYKRYGIRVFPFLLLFLLFDIEAVILFPWAIEAKKFGIYAIIEAAIFILILFLGYIFILKNRGLDLK